MVGPIIFGRKPFVFIGGPCVIEGREITLRAADKLREITSALGVPFVFKSSYDKANRTSVSSFRGPGVKEGLQILKEVKDRTGVPILTDVHSPDEARAGIGSCRYPPGTRPAVEADRPARSVRQDGPGGEHQERAVPFSR